MRIISAAAQKNSFSSSRKKEKGVSVAGTKSHVSFGDLPISPGIRGRAFRTRCDETRRDGTRRDGTRPFFVGLARGNAQPLRTHSSTERLETARRLLSHALWMIHERSNRVGYVACFCKNHRFSTALSENRAIQTRRFSGWKLNSRNFESVRRVRREIFDSRSWWKIGGDRYSVWNCSNDSIRCKKKRVSARINCVNVSWLKKMFLDIQEDVEKCSLALIKCIIYIIIKTFNMNYQ